MFKKLITKLSFVFFPKKQQKLQQPNCRSKGMICENFGGCPSSCQDNTVLWEERKLGAQEQYVRKASQADDDALQDALGLPRKQPKE